MSKKVLIADDDLDNRTIAREVLEAAGFEVVEARDGLETLSLVMSAHPDVLLLDLSMPKMNGWEVAKKLRENDSNAQLPIIAFTAHAIVGDELKAKGSGCDDYLSKPCIPSDVVKKVSHWFEKRAQG
jgi:two-component system cell cycle response regulator DivK